MSGKRIISVMITAVLLLISACGTSPDSASDSREVYSPELAEKYAEEGNYEKALEVYTVLIDEDPDNTDLYLGRAEVYVRTEKYPEATEDYTQVVNIDNKNAEAHVKRGIIRYVTGDKEKGDQDLQEVAAITEEYSEEEKKKLYTEIKTYIVIFRFENVRKLDTDGYYAVDYELPDGSHIILANDEEYTFSIDRFDAGEEIKIDLDKKNHEPEPEPEPEKQESKPEPKKPEHPEYTAYRDAVEELIRKYGEPKMEKTEGEGWEDDEEWYSEELYHLKGLAFAELIDFNNDGKEELITAYYSDDYHIDVYSYSDGTLYANRNFSPEWSDEGIDLVLYKAGNNILLYYSGGDLASAVEEWYQFKNNAFTTIRTVTYSFNGSGERTSKATGVSSNEVGSLYRQYWLESYFSEQDVQTTKDQASKTIQFLRNYKE